MFLLHQTSRNRLVTNYVVDILHILFFYINIIETWHFSFDELVEPFKGAKLLNYVLDTARKGPKLREVYLHVLTSNEDAKQFDLANGFVEIGTV